MGAGGTAMAAAAADIVMMSDNLLRLPATIQLCRLARSIIIQNCILSILVKIVAVVLAVMGKDMRCYGPVRVAYFFLLFTVGKLSFWQAVLIDVGTLLAVICNGTRPLNSDVYRDTQQETSNKKHKKSFGSEPSDGASIVGLNLANRHLSKEAGDGNFEDLESPLLNQ